MQVAQYTYTSPSPSPVQVGKLDQNSVKEESSSTPPLPKSVTNESTSKVEDFEMTQKTEVTSSVSSSKLDVYV
jgi:hypothetical protein